MLVNGGLILRSKAQRSKSLGTNMWKIVFRPSSKLDRFFVNRISCLIMSAADSCCGGSQWCCWLQGQAGEKGYKGDTGLPGFDGIPGTKVRVV